MRLLIAIILICITHTCNADLNLLSGSIVKISNPEGYYGTGFAYKEDKDYYFICTAGHCVHGNDYAEYLYNGQFVKIPLEKIYKRYDNEYSEVTIYDIGILRMKKSDMEKYGKLTVIPLCEKTEFEAGRKIHTFGCAKGGAPSGFVGTITEKYEQEFLFKPRGLAGRSGSPIMLSNGNTIIGILVHSNDELGWSRAITTNHIRNMLEGVVNVESNNN